MPPTPNERSFGQETNSRPLLHQLGVAAGLVGLCGLMWLRARGRKRVWRLAGRVAKARAVVAGEGAVLTEKSFGAILGLYRPISAHSSTWVREHISREYDTVEFFACVGPEGVIQETPGEVLADYHRRAGRDPGLAQWFREDRTHEGRPVLLPARWLCHLVGLRHGTAHLAITLAGEPEMVLLQVRAMRKVEAPGCFDLPVAGHVDGAQTYTETLWKEAGEEIGAGPELLRNVKEVGGYAGVSRSADGRMLNLEFHRVYTAEIAREDIARLRPDPSEVATVLVIERAELARLMGAFPDRFAMGIRDTVRYFPRLSINAGAASSFTRGWIQSGY